MFDKRNQMCAIYEKILLCTGMVTLEPSMMGDVRAGSFSSLLI